MATMLGMLLAACASGPKQTTTSGYRASGGAITVVEFEQQGVRIKYNAPHDTFGLAVAEEIAGALRKRGHRADAVRTGSVPTGSIIVSGRVALIDAGSRGLRWVTIGAAGHAKFGVEGSVRNVQGGEVASFSNERWSGFGFLGGNSISKVRKCLRAVGRDVAEMIDTGQYKGMESGR
ncbi:MAG: DUF4410 domain-containing protein [Deltaproteobacteria bacterium]|nr:DUF4410 domain-containing protein [Deltaproteobacteria bacterium]